MATKKGQVHIVSILIACPHCQENVEEPQSGSIVFEESDLERLPRSFQCSSCNYWLDRPTWPKSRVKAGA